MSMGQETKIRARDNDKLALKVTKGHFSSDRFHINYYIDMTTLKMRQEEAEQVAKSMVKRYVNRVDLSGLIGVGAEELKHYSKAFASKTPIDTIICMDGCEVIGAYVAKELSELGVTTTNIHKTTYIVTPEFDSAGQMVVRDNIKHMLKDKHVLVVLATAMSGRTILKSIPTPAFWKASPLSSPHSMRSTDIRLTRYSILPIFPTSVSPSRRTVRIVRTESSWMRL